MIGAAVLAAGRGRRFGATKQLALLDGRPLLEHAVHAANSVGELDKVLVVLGAHAREIRQGCNFARAESITCPAWREGIAGSLRCAVEEMSEAKALVIMLGDQPGVTAGAIRAVLAGLASAKAARAVYRGRPGHPVAVRPELFPKLGKLNGDQGARSLLIRVGAAEIECDALANPLDVDTKRDLELLQNQL